MIRTLLISLLAVVAHAQAPLTNADVVKMAQQGINQASLIEAIKSARSVAFQITPQDQPALEDASVSRSVIVAMIERVRRDEARSNYPEAPMEGTKRVPVNRIVQPRAPRVPVTGEWGLAPGRPEMLFRAGGVGYIVDSATKYSWSLGLGTAVGVSRYVAVSGEYNYNHIASASTSDVSSGILINAKASVRMHDFIGGVRVSGPWKAAPYAFAGGGLAALQTSGSGSAPAFGITVDQSSTLTKPALAVGGGLNTSITPRFGVLVDARAIRPIDFPWYARVTGGFYVRF